MVIFNDEDLADCPVLSEWQIVGDLRQQPQIFGTHAFHEGRRTAVAEIVIADPLLRWVTTPYGAYRLGGGGTLGRECARFGVEKLDH